MNVNMSLLNSIITYLLLLQTRLAIAVDCRLIGIGTLRGVNGQTVQLLDPFTPGQGFDIVKATDCLVRFQVPDSNNPDVTAAMMNGMRCLPIQSLPTRSSLH